MPRKAGVTVQVQCAEAFFETSGTKMKSHAWLAMNTCCQMADKQEMRFIRMRAHGTESEVERNLAG